MSSNRAVSFSVSIRIPVAWGAKTWAMPFLIPEELTASWVLSDKSMKSISPRVANFKVLFTTLKPDIIFLQWFIGCFAEKLF